VQGLWYILEGREMHAEFWYENVKGRDQLGRPRFRRRIILRPILSNKGGGMD
jgi:hypothetical protein